MRERDRAGMEAGIAAGREVLAWQSYEPLGHVVSGDTVVTRLLWKGELAIDAGPWEKGTRLTAWCVAHFTLRDGRIAHIEQHDCYEPPVPPWLIAFETSARVADSHVPQGCPHI